jgi:5-methyltetrahydropteroyltriglutamate--homocysteine methyltransferase
MQTLVANHSSYPIGSEGAAAPSPLAAVLAAQAAAGADIVTDGQIGWSDPIAPPFARLDGVRWGESRPLPFAALPYRVPIVEAKLRRRRPLLVDAYRQARAATSRPCKVVCPGPFTLAHLAEIRTTAYRNAGALAADLAIILAEETGALAAAGATVVQLDEPAILAHPGDVRLLRELLEPVYDAAAGQVQLIVTTYGADAAPLYAQLNSLPADVIGFDCASAPAVLEAVAQTGAARVLALGVVAGDRAALEDEAALIRAVEHALHRYVHPQLHLQPSCGLGPLTPEAAHAKLRLLCRTRTALARRRGG